MATKSCILMEKIDLKDLDLNKKNGITFVSPIEYKVKSLGQMERN